MREQIIYEKIADYQTPASLPMQQKDFYQQTFAEYLGYYVKNLAQMKRCLFALKWWEKLSKILNFSQSIDLEQRDCYYKQNDKMTGYRESLISLSYSALLEDDESKTTPACRAASLVHSALHFHYRLHHGDLPQDKIKEQPLEMGQYANLFGTHLIAEKKVDRIFKSENTGYIIILRGGNFYRMELPHPYSPEALLNIFEDFILQTDEIIRLPSGLTYLSGCRRDTVGKSTHQLLKDSVNRANFEVLNNAFLIVNLDLENLPTERGEAHRFVYSGNLKNRWFHTSLQIVIFGNGKAGVVLSNRNYIDGNCGSRFASELFLAARALKWNLQDGQIKPNTFVSLPFRIPFAMAEKWKEEASSYTRPSADLFTFQDIGSISLNNGMANPDTMFMIALQMAARKKFGRFTTIIQLVNMSLFRHMGLNHALISTPEVQALIDFLDSGKKEVTKNNIYLQNAIRSYKKAQVQARKGMPTIHILHYWLTNANMVQKIISLIFLQFTGVLSCKADAITSHPKMYPGVKSFGRPGIYIPYLDLFGLHYVIHEKSIDLIFMPAKNKNIDLAGFSEDIYGSLLVLQKILCADPSVKIAGVQDKSEIPHTEVSLS